MLIVPTLGQGGMERVCVNTARLLEPYYEPIIVVFNGADTAFDIEGLNIIDIRRGARSGWLAKLINIVIRTMKLKKLKRDLKPIFAYSFGPTANIVNSLSKTNETKVWVSLRNYIDIHETQKIKLFIKKADMITTCSEELTKALKDIFHYTKAVTIYNPYNIPEIKRIAALGEPLLPWDDAELGSNVLISMGRDDDLKGFWHTIKVFYLVHQVFPDAKLIIVGALLAEYSKLLDDLGISQSVHITGPQKEPYCYLKKGTVYLLNSNNEGFPNALAEAMIMGMAVVACDCPTGPAEILLKSCPAESERQKIYHEKSVIWGEYGILVPNMDKAKNLDASVITQEERNMADVVIKLLSDSELLNAYKKVAGERIMCFTSESYTEHFIAPFTQSH